MARKILTLVMAGMLTLSLLLSAMISMHPIAPAIANSIPVPTLIMPEEYINATISLSDGRMLAKVDGAYPFHNVRYTTVKMLYPVPPDATSISVKMNDTSLDWSYGGEIYPTVIGDCPMINWTIAPVPAYFIMKTSYEHDVPRVNGSFMFLYAMGTGRFLDTYAKQTTAYVNIRMETDYTNLNVYTVFYCNGSGWRTPRNYTITEESGVRVISLQVVSGLFHPLVEDLVITFGPQTGPVGDINLDGELDISDIVLACKSYGSRLGGTNWNSYADLAPPYGIIDILDLVTCASHYGQKSP